MATIITYIMVSIMICVATGLTIVFTCFENSNTQVKIRAFVYGLFIWPVIGIGISSMIFIEPDMEMSRFLVGLGLVTAAWWSYIKYGYNLVEKEEAK